MVRCVLPWCSLPWRVSELDVGCDVCKRVVILDVSVAHERFV